MTETSPRRQALFRAVIASVLVLSALATSELAGAIVYRRLYGPYHDAVGAYLAQGRNPQPEWIPDPLCHHRPNPAVAHNEVNRHRTRGADFPPVKAPDELRIVCVGDSTTEGLTLPADQAYPAFLERFLAEILPGRHVTAINGGVSNHNSAFNLSYLGLSLIHLQPDVVVIKSSYNDYVSYQSSLLDHDYSLLPVYCLHPLPEPPPLWVRLSQWGKVSTARHLSAVQKGFGAGQYPLRDASRMTSDEVIDDNLEHSTIYREQILGMVGIARANGAEPVLLDLPLAPDAGPREFVRIVGHFNRELVQVAGTAKVPLVRTADGLGANDFLDRCHNYSQGHQRIAARVANQLASRMGVRERWDEVDSGAFRFLDVSGPPAIENDPATLFDPAPTGLRLLHGHGKAEGLRPRPRPHGGQRAAHPHLDRPRRVARDALDRHLRRWARMAGGAERREPVAARRHHRPARRGPLRESGGTQAAGPELAVVAAAQRMGAGTHR